MSTRSGDAGHELGLAEANQSMTPAVGEELINPVAGTRTVFTATASSTNGAYVEVEATYPPHSGHPPMHRHPQQQERFVIVKGLLHAVVDEVAFDLGPGEVLEVPVGADHQMWGNADTPTVVVWRTSPALRTDQMYCDLWQAAADAAFRPTIESLAHVILRYPDEFCLC
jgi:mannose-6-phosphate isomerase-like protein (cupin superfamily)